MKLKDFLFIIVEFVIAIITFFYIFVRTIENQYIVLILLPLLFVFFIILTIRLYTGFNNEPLIYIMNIFFFFKIIIIPICFVLENFNLNYFTSTVGNNITNGVCYQIAEFIIVIGCYLILRRKKSVISKNKSMEIIRGNNKLSKSKRYFLVIFIFIYLLIIFSHPNYLDYFVLFDFNKSEIMINQHSGALYAIFVFISQLIYLFAPLYLVSLIYNSKFKYKVIMYFLVILFPFIISTVNHYQSFIIDLTICIFLCYKYPKYKARIIVLIILTIPFLPNLLGSKISGSLTFSFNAYLGGFISFAGYSTISAVTNKWTYFITDIIKSIPFISGMIPTYKISNTLFNYALFHSERTDQFIPTYAQVDFYFNILTPFIYILLIYLLLYFQKIFKNSTHSFSYMYCLLILIQFSYSILAGNLNHLISMLFSITLIYIYFKPKQRRKNKCLHC